MHAGKLIFAQENGVRTGDHVWVPAENHVKSRIWIAVAVHPGGPRLQTVGPEPVFTCEVTDPKHYVIRKSAAPSRA